jgi:dienelactone hydrolase
MSMLTRRGLLSSLLASGFARAAEPDLANLFPLLEANSLAQPRKLGFMDPRWKKLDAWKKEARPELIRLLRYNPTALPLSAKVEGTEQREGFRIERVTISATAQHSIPGWVLLPEKQRAGKPGIIAIHDHSGRYVWGHEKILSAPGEPAFLTEFRNGAYGRPYAEELARRGFVVLVIDGFYFGSRRLRVEDMDPTTAPPVFRTRLNALTKLDRTTAEWSRAVDGLCSEFEHLTAKTIFTSGATWPGILAWDDRRAVDYLSSRPEVNPARIGCLGLSIGGLRTGYLIGSDPRIKAACIMGWMTEFHGQLRNHLRNHTWMVYVPGLTGVMDLPDVAALHAPGALLVQQCRRDALFPVEAMQGALTRLEQLYAKAGMKERFRGSFHDVPHSFLPAMQAEAFDWLERWL